nr:MAG TPA: hypothetical protein [Caudoviricetes sp.]
MSNLIIRKLCKCKISMSAEKIICYWKKSL